MTAYEMKTAILLSQAEQVRLKSLECVAVLGGECD